MTTRHPVSFSSIARMELTELPTHVKGAWQVTASRWPDRENKVNRHSPRSHCHCLTRSPTHPASIHSFTQHSSTDRGSIYLPRIQSKRRESVTCNLQPTSNQSCTDIINQQLTCGPRALCLPWPVKKKVPGVPGIPPQVQLPHIEHSIPSTCRLPSGVTHFSAAASSSTYK